MDLSFFVIQALNGLASASSLFLIASGLTLVFGVTRIVNFAHGSLYMLGAYFAATLAPALAAHLGREIGFWGAIGLSAIAVGLLGVALEALLLRRIYKAPELFQLLATFGVVLVVQDLVVIAFGPQDILGPRAPGLTGFVEILGRRFPVYELFLIAVGPAVLLALWLLLTRTRFGILARAATQDREMVAALGVDQAKLFTATLFLGSVLAGLGGALQIPRAPAHMGMDLAIVAEAFVVAVIGGMGSAPGAFLAALLIGQVQAFGILVFPRITLVVVFLLMAAVLILRPHGLLGRPEPIGAGPGPSASLSLRPWSRLETALAAIAAVGLAAAPLLLDAYGVTVATEVVVLALLAFSLHLLVGVGGLVSFGHAAWFGLGAYAAALAVRQGGLPMEAALPLAPVVAGLGAGLFGLLVARLSGIYLAMLTLAVAQILYAVAFQWVEATGGDNGIVGVWPSAWAADRATYYWLALALALAAVYGLRRAMYAPFGHALRGARDSALRAEAIGVDVRGARRAAFALSGAAAGLAGGLWAFLKGTTDPTVLAIPVSVDALAMLLIGGAQTVIGPLVGAGVLHLARDLAMPVADQWRMILGGFIVGVVLLAPRGIVGAIEEARARLAARR